MTTKILIVEDEQAIRNMICFMLKQRNYHTMEAESAEEAKVLLSTQVPDIILMDWMLPGLSGIEFTRELKKNDVTCNIPVIMLTARGEEDDKVRGLNCGAEDYVTKPFSPKELIARIKVILRRVVPHASEETVKVGSLQLDPTAFRVSVNEQEVSLGPTEFRLLHFLMTHTDKVYSRPRLLDHVWGMNVFVEERTVDVHIRRLRKALEPYGVDGFIQTIRGAGYRFSEPRTVQ